MSQQHHSWQPLDQGAPLLSAAKPLKIDLLPGAYGQLRLRCLEDGFPEGELSLIFSDGTETRHWQVPAQAKGDVLEASLAGSQAAYDPADGRPLSLCLARRTREGLEQYQFTAGRYNSRLDVNQRCEYLFDDRDLWGNPVDSFFQGDVLYETYPSYQLDGSGRAHPALFQMPRCMRYWRQMSYALSQVSLGEGTLSLTAEPPAGGPELAGFALWQAEGGEREIWIPGYPREQAVCGVLDLSRLPLEGGRWELGGVLDGGDGVHYYVPLSITRPQCHQAMELAANGGPLRQELENGCYLQVDDLCRLSFWAGKTEPNAQTGLELPGLCQALREDLLPVKGHLAIGNLGGKDWRWRFELPGWTLDREDELWLTVWNGTDRLVLPVQMLSADGQKSILSADLSAMGPSLQSGTVIKWMLALAIRRGETYFHVRLRLPLQTIRRRLDTDMTYLNYIFAHNPPFGEIPLGDQKVEALICCPWDGYCQIQTAEELRRYEYQLTCRAEFAKIRGTRLKMKVWCPNDVPGRWTGFALKKRYRLELDREVFFAPAKHIHVGEGETWMTAEIDLSQYHFSPLYWDIRAVFTDEAGISRLVRVRAAKADKEATAQSKALRKRWKQLERAIFPGGYRQGEDQAVSLYQTMKRNYALVCQEYTPYSGPLFRLKERLAILIHKRLRKQLAKKNIFLVYEKYCCMAQDNGFYFFRHCMEAGMEEKMHRSIYYVIDKKQPDYQERLLPYKDHVIQFMSLKHMVYLLAARLLISSDSKAHAYAWRAKESVIIPRINKGKKLVFLQHGVIALKRVGFYSKGANAVNLFVTSNQREHDIIVKEMEYPPEDVIITGLARWDVLEDKSGGERHILVMPTWRNWLEEVTDVVFMASDYYRNYMSLLNDARLARLLEEQDLYLDFYIHPKFREYMADFTVANGDRVRMIPFGSEPLNQLIMKCKMLVTDYSSVCWDVYYQGKPVLFYQFDLEQYNETTGSYIDMETELFGDRVLTTEELLSALEAYAKTDFALPERYAEMRPHMYAYLDRNNSQRVCQEIMKRNW